MINDIKKDATERMQKCVDSLKSALVKLRTGRANAALLDHVTADYYGNQVPLSQCATIVVEDARTISITPWEKSMVVVIEKAILKSDLGLNPNTAGMIIRINMPPLTEERRRDLAKVVRGEAEGARVAIRNVRRDSNQDVKELAKEKLISEDEEKRAETEVQKLTDQFVARVDELAAVKEKELMSM
ncbi:MAG: ribosome recycling factor [Panacagrimonas sp.]